MRTHISGLGPNAFDSRTAISADMPAFSLTRLLTVWRATPSTLAASVTVKPNGSRKSWRTMRPGCGWFFMGIFVPLMVIDQIDIVRVSVREAEGDSPIPAHGYRPDSLLVSR